MTNAVSREDTLSAVRHPDPMPVWVAGPGCELIVDPLADPIQQGDLLLGWEGDPRLGLYLNVPRRQWQLWRFEHDGVYRLVAQRPAGGPGGMSAAHVCASLVMHLCAHDTRRGYDVKAAVDAQNAELDRQAAKAMADRLTNDLNDKLRWAMRRDGALDEVTGIDAQQMRDYNAGLDAFEAAEAEETP